MLTLFRGQLWQSPLRLLRLARRVLLTVLGRVARQIDRWSPTLGRLVATCCGCCRRTRIGDGDGYRPAFAPAVASLDEELNRPGPPAPSLVEAPSYFQPSRLSSSRRSSSCLGILRPSGPAGAAPASNAGAEGSQERWLGEKPPGCETRGTAVEEGRTSHNPDLNDLVPTYSFRPGGMESPRVGVFRDHKPPPPPRESAWQGEPSATPPPSPPSPQVSPPSPPRLPRPSSGPSTSFKYEPAAKQQRAEFGNLAAKGAKAQGSNQALEPTKSASVSSAAAPPPAVLPLQLNLVRPTVAAAAAPADTPHATAARAPAPRSVRLAAQGYRAFDFEAAETLEPGRLEAAPEEVCTPAVHELRSFEPAAVREVLHPIALRLCDLFGFQKAQPGGAGEADAWVRSNLDNQVEHLLGLLLCRMDSCGEATIEDALSIAVRQPPRETPAQTQALPPP